MQLQVMISLVMINIRILDIQMTGSIGKMKWYEEE